ALERRPDGRMELEALELVVGRQMRVRVIEVHDEAERDEIVAVVIDERTAAGGVVERPTLAVYDEPGPVLRGCDLPHFLDADAVLLRIDAVTQREPLHQRLRQRSATTFGEQRIARAKLHAGLIRGLVRAV